MGADPGRPPAPGAVPFRDREHDFESVAHAEGEAPPWQLRCKDVAPWYNKTENCTGYRLLKRDGIMSGHIDGSGQVSAAGARGHANKLWAFGRLVTCKVHCLSSPAAGQLRTYSGPRRRE